MGNAAVRSDRKTLEARLAEVRKGLEQYPDSWLYLGETGRILRCLGDPEASEYFRRAIANFRFHPKLGDKYPDDNMRLGNLYRLSGDREEALRYFQRARELYVEAIREKYKWKYPDPSMEIERMIQASFLVKEDEEVADLIEQFRILEPDITLLVYPIAKLAAARRSRDARHALEVVDEFARMIRRERIPVWESYGVTLWDWHEIAMEVLGELSSQKAAEPEQPDSEQPQSVV